MRNVGEKRPEGHEQLDAEVAGEGDDLLAERPPTRIRLDPEHEDGVAVRLRDGRVVEGRLRPVDSARHTLLEANLRPHRLEVEELLGIELGEAARVPALGEEAGGQRGALGTVVPAPEGGDENGAAEAGAALDAEMPGDARSLGEPGP